LYLKIFSLHHFIKISWSNESMRAIAYFLMLLATILGLFSCSSVGPVYQFYAHKHDVPNFSADVIDIPQSAPSDQITYSSRYAPIIEEAMTLIEAHRNSIHSPGISAAIAIDGDMVWAGTSGWADIAKNQPLTPNSQFRIGSTSKAVNATLLAKLVEDNVLTLDTPLSAYRLSELNPSWRAITPRQLASHTAGMPHYKHNTDYRGLIKSIALTTHYEDVEDALDVFDSSDLLFAPGEQFSYSSLGTVLLSAVMQEAAQTPYQQLIEEEVFSPLALKSTMPEPIASERQQRAPNLVKFYWHPDYAEDKVAVWRDVDLSHRLAGGGFISTSTDLVKLGLGFIDERFLSKVVREQFWTPQTLNNGEINEQHYAIGWRVRDSDFGDKLGTIFHANHGGVSRGAQSWLMVLPEYKMAVAININSKTDEFWDFGKLSFKLVSLFLEFRNTPRETKI
jgi:CubicO group peptidase (beta-lactamase class C family)